MKVDEDLIKVMRRGKSLYGHFSHLATKKGCKNSAISGTYHGLAAALRIQLK